MAFGGVEPGAVALVEVDLGRLARVARRRGATVNDVLLAAVSEGVVAALRAAGEPVPEVVPVSVPVALPTPGASGNAVGVMVVRLPTAEPDPDVRLSRIAEITRSAKEEARRQGTFQFSSRWGTRVFAWSPAARTAAAAG